MAERLSRRKFLKQGAVMAGTALGGAALGAGLPTAGAAGTRPDIFVVQGTDYFNNTLRAVDGLGGMAGIVSRGSRVGLLINHYFMNLGAHVHPDMVVAVAKTCFEAGAKEVVQIKSPSWRYFNRAGEGKEIQDVIRQLKPPSGDYRAIPIKGALALKEAKIMKDLLECDVFINMAIVKSHSATYISAVLKNMMGSAPFSTCRKFHTGGWFKDEPHHLAQCIADINLVRKPDLCVMDATEVLATGGPHGPGIIKKPRKVFAGRDPVAVDAFSVELLGLDQEEILMLDFAAKHGLGEKDLAKVRVEEVMV